MADNLTPAQRRRAMAAVKSKNTTPELLVRRIVHSLGYRFRLHVRELPGTPDIVLPRLRKVINVSGCFWHLHGCRWCRTPNSRRSYWDEKLKRNAERDRRTKKELIQAGWTVLVVWECQTRPERLGRLRSRLARFLADAG